ncbi:MAG: sugar phosphate isomerase/epimerase family protein [Desulfatiglandales bacterium]
MKLSCLPVSLFKELDSGEMSIKQWAEYGKSIGLDAIDLMMVNIKAHTPKYLKTINEGLEEAGIGIAMITTYPDFTHPHEFQREREVEYLRNDIAVASQLNAKMLRVTAGQAHPETGREDGIKWAIEGLKKVEKIGEKYGVTLVYEDHSKPGGWDYMDFSNPPDIFLEIAKGIKDTSIGINFDTANILVAGEERTVEVLEEVIDQVESIHVADMATKGAMDPTLIGTGIVPNKEVFAYLKKHGWDKWLCIEEWGNQGLEGIKKAVEYTRNAWEEA